MSSSMLVLSLLEPRGGSLSFDKLVGHRTSRVEMHGAYLEPVNLDLRVVVLLLS